MMTINQVSLLNPSYTARPTFTYAGKAFVYPTAGISSSPQRPLSYLKVAAFTAVCATVSMLVIGGISSMFFKKSMATATDHLVNLMTDVPCYITGALMGAWISNKRFFQSNS